MLRRFDGEEWQNLDHLFRGDEFGDLEDTAIEAMVVHEGELYIGGSFTLVRTPDGVRSSSGLARLRVEHSADLDRDGTLTMFDFLNFFNLFEARDTRADFNDDGEWTLLDFIAFRDAFDSGCP